MGRLFHRQGSTNSLLGLIAFLLLMASPVAAISISATENIPNWVLNPGTNTDPTNLILHVTTETTPWTLTVMDAHAGGKDASLAGRLAEYNSSTGAWVNNGQALSTNLTVIGDNTQNNIVGTTATLGPTDALIETGSVAVSNQQLGITLSQPVTYGDPYLSNGDVYRVVLTFTVTQT